MHVEILAIHPFGAVWWAWQTVSSFTALIVLGIGVARGCTGYTCTPRTEKNVGATFTGESCKCTPQAECLPPPEASQVNDVDRRRL